MSNKAVSFANFKKQDSPHSFSKKGSGILGPFMDGTLKIRIPRNKNPNYISLEESGENMIFNFRDKNVSIPIKCVITNDLDSKNLVVVKTNMNWFDDEANSSLFEDFIDYYLTSKIVGDKNPMQPILDDLEIVLDVLGVDSGVKKIHQLGQKSYECELENGYFIELFKKDDLDLFKKISFYQKDSDIHPCLTIQRSPGEFICKYKTPHCKFESNHDSFKDIFSSPVDSYLIGICLGLETEQRQRELVDYLMKALKYHTWKDNSNSREEIEKNKKEHLEILKVMDALKNTIPEKHIEEMYSDARSKFYNR